MVQSFIFYLFAVVVVTSGVMVISARNPVHSVLWLILAFFNAAGLMLLIGAEFIAVILVIVYVGAVAVLFLFVVMMLDIDFTQLRAGFAKYLPFGLALAAVLLAQLVLVGGAWAISDVAPTVKLAPTANTPGLSNTQSIGALLYTRYFFIFQASGMVLLTAMIGAIVLTHRQRGGVRRQDIARQNARTPATAIDNARPELGAGISLNQGVAKSGNVPMVDHDR